MKRITTAVLALSLAFAGSSALAWGGKDPEKRGERLQQELNLTDAQRQQVEAIFRQAQERHGAVHAETRQALSGVLTPEQLKQFDEQREQRHGKHGEKGKGKDCDRDGKKEGKDKPKHH